MVQFASYLRRVLFKTRLIFPRINGPIILPGHFCGLHCWVRSSGPLPEQSLPPNWGEGLVQFLCLFIVPPPQVTLQDDHLDHSVYPPLTILKYKPVIIKDNVNLR